MMRYMNLCLGGLLFSLLTNLTPLGTLTNTLTEAFLPFTSASAQTAIALPIEGAASWYGPGFAGRLTANGETFNPAELTAAHRTLPFGTRLRVVDLATGRSVVVRINDRGPYAGNRIIDLSRAAAQQIGMIDRGVARVRLEPLTPPATQEASVPAPLIAAPVPDAPLEALAAPELASYDIATNEYDPGALLLVRSPTQTEPLMVRVVAYDGLEAT
ncbi:MAG: septal ring lytic transglycosylase RlpA family protein [Trueperaceae bacterium]|nr:septal ring lytic transglycosylase RlpA family protein [Trueperaceae bacterium]